MVLVVDIGRYVVEFGGRGRFSVAGRREHAGVASAAAQFLRHRRPADRHANSRPGGNVSLSQPAFFSTFLFFFKRKNFKN